jgi:hypothetical protein
MPARLHLIKLCVGIDSVEDLIAWRARAQAKDRAEGRAEVSEHVTRMWPKRADEILDGGSLFWVIKGLVLVRQRITGFTARTGSDGIRRCAINFDPNLTRTVPQPRRAFQGWRYLRPEDAPRDLIGPGVSDLPLNLAADLARIGVI